MKKYSRGEFDDKEKKSLFSNVFGTMSTVRLINHISDLPTFEHHHIR